jgi:hypothetical protein
MSAPTLDDWINSLCRPGSYQATGGARLPNATSDTWCVSNSSGTGIAFYTYSSADLMKRDLALGQGTYATKTDSSGVVWLIRSYASRRPVLAPPATFGSSEISTSSTDPSGRRASRKAV